MPLFELTKDSMEPIGAASFAELGYRERDDLQRLLRERIDAIVPDGFVIAEEFCDWDDSNRRIDLLVLDRDANLVVVELKRTDDGGHSELQALRYAAMVSMITFEQVVEAHRGFVSRIGIDADPQLRILDFLGWSEPDEERFAQEVRIVLASAEFSKELTTTVIWLNDQGIDVRCVRMKPYRSDGKAILDVQQILPLPETQDYQVRVREKNSSEKIARRGQTDRERKFLSFWEGLLAKANQRSPLHQNISPSKESWVQTSSRGLVMAYVLARDKGRVELFISRSVSVENKKIFDGLWLNRSQVEIDFGGPLKWERLDERVASRISHEVASEGSFQDESKWGALQDDMVAAMLKLEKTLGPHIQKFRDGAQVELPEAS